MYLIKVPLLYIRLEIYQGEKEFKRYKKVISSFESCKDFEDETYLDHKDGGVAAGSMIWVENIMNQNTMFHELQHVIDHLASSHKFEKELEFRAYLAGFLSVEIIDIINKEKEKREVLELAQQK